MLECVQIWLETGSRLDRHPALGRVPDVLNHELAVLAEAGVVDAMRVVRLTDLVETTVALLPISNYDSVEVTPLRS